MNFKSVFSKASLIGAALLMITTTAFAGHGPGDGTGNGGNGPGDGTGNGPGDCSITKSVMDSHFIFLARGGNGRGGNGNGGHGPGDGTGNGGNGPGDGTGNGPASGDCPNA